MKETRISELEIKMNVIGKMTEFFVKRTEMAALLVLLTLAIGIFSYIQLPKESLPEIVFPSITVSTVYPGASPEDVEGLLTVPIEAALGRLSDVEDLFSQSGEGLSVVTVSFTEGVDMDSKKIELDNALADVRMPEGALEPESFIFKTSEIPLISVSLVGEDLYELTEVAEAVEKDLEKLSGVDDVNVFGGAEEEIQVTVDSDMLVEEGLTLNDLSNALAAANISLPLGETSTSGNRFTLRIDETLNDLDSIRETPVLIPGREPLIIDDVAEVAYGRKKVTEFNRTFTEDGRLSNSVFLNVIRENRKDVIGTSDDVKNRLEALEGSLIPSDVDVVISRDTADLVRDDLDSVLGNALSGLIVVVLVLFLFIGFREALIVAITIPLTLMATLGTLSFFGITLNTFAVLGLIVALGLLVDNTIIVMENMDRLKRKGLDYEKAAVFGTNQVGFPITAATMTTVAAFFPLAILPGIIGAFINTIPRTIIITLLLSLAFAIAVTPSVYALVNRTVKQKTIRKKWMALSAGLLKVMLVGGLSVLAFYGEELWLGIPVIAAVFFMTLTGLKVFRDSSVQMEDYRIVKAYRNFIYNTVRSRVRMAAVVVFAAVLLASSALLFTSGRLKVAFFPQTEPSSLTINVALPSGQSLDMISEKVGEVESLLMASEHVKQFNTTIGGNEINNSVITLDLRDNDSNGFDQMDRIQTKLSEVEGADITVEAVAAGGPPVGKPIEVKFVGDSILANKEAADTFTDLLQDTEGVFNIEQSQAEGSSELLLDIDMNRAAELGMNPIYIASQLRDYTEGIVATSRTENGVQTDVRVMVIPQLIDGRDQSDNLGESDSTTAGAVLQGIQIKTPLGVFVALDEVVDIKASTGISGITRENGNRTVTVTADLRNGYNASEVMDGLKASMAEAVIDDSVAVNYDGEAAGISESFNDLFRSMILAVFLVFMILTIQFGSIKQPFIILSTVPMALIGVLYGLAATGNEFGFYAFMALVSLVGIAVNDAIVLIDYMNYLRKQGVPFYDAVAEAGRTRFNPVLATTMTTIGGILPLSFKNAYYAQFGFALIFGLLVTTMLTLVMIPVFYSVFEGKKVRKSQRNSNDTAAEEVDLDSSHIPAA